MIANDACELLVARVGTDAAEESSGLHFPAWVGAKHRHLLLVRKLRRREGLAPRTDPQTSLGTGA